MRLARVEAVLEAVRKGRESLDGLIELRRGRSTIGAIRALLLPGRSAMVSPPSVARNEAEDNGPEEENAFALLNEMDVWLREQDVRIAQALLDPNSSVDARRFSRHGYHHVADLLYLLSSKAAFPDEQPRGALGFHSFSESDRERLKRLVEATYEGTLDIPALDNVRDTGDVLDGYRSLDPHDNSLWRMITNGGVDIGCLLLTDQPYQEQMELVYWGLIPEARGNGWGREIVRQAQWEARVAGRDRLVAAVDAENLPAISGYVQSGFLQWDRRAVYLQVYEPERF